MQAISKAAAAKDTSVEFALCGTRKVLLGEYKGMTWVHFRDRPADCPHLEVCKGRGIGLQKAEWIQLVTVLPQIRASL